MDKNISVSIMLDLYGGLLTKNQLDTMVLYYNEDFSLGEIAEELNVTRQAVLDTIRKSEKKLIQFEEKLKLMVKFSDTNQQIEKLIERIEKGEEIDGIISSLRKIQEQL